MVTAVLQIEKHSLTLKSGAYLIRGSVTEGTEEEHHSVYIDNESVDDKHAMIVADADGLFVYDLNTRFGTFVNEQRLPILTKYIISGDVCIRFGKVEGKLNMCFELERNHSSGFHDDSLHTSDAENLTIPETQFIIPQNCVNSSSIKNISHNASIPETQDVLESTSSFTLNTKKTETSEQESQFCMSTQEFNDCLNVSNDSNSRDFLDNINWLIGDEQPTAIKQTTNEKNNDRNNQTPEMENESKLIVEEMVADAEDLRSQTHTPDLFDVGILFEFEKKEARIKNARANRAQNEIPTTEDTQASATKDVDSEERTETASEKSFTHEPPDFLEKSISRGTTPPPPDIKNNEAVGHSAVEKSTENTKQSDQMELDLFEGERLQNDPQESGICNEPPLQHSNKENMLMEDFEPTQVFVSKKDMKPPAVLPPVNATSLSTASFVGSDFEPTQVYVPKKIRDAAMKSPVNAISPSTCSLVGSDFDPTQVYVPKKNKDAGFIKPLASNKKELPKDDMDLEPTQIFVPKKSSINIIKSDANTEKETVNLVSTMAQNEQEPEKQSADEKSALVQDEQPSGSLKTPNHRSSAMASQIMLTPEFLSNTFAEQKPPDTTSRRNLLSCLDNDQDLDDTLTRLLTHHRFKSDFDGLIDSIKKTENFSKESLQPEESDELLNKYIDTKTDEAPKQMENEKKPVCLEKSSPSMASSSSHCLKSSRNISEEPVIEMKRIKINENSPKNIVSNDKSFPERENRMLKRSATVDEAAIAISKKSMKMKTNDDGVNASVATRSHKGRATRSSKPVSDIAQESNKRVDNKKTDQKTLNSSSGNTVTKSSSSAKSEKSDEAKKKRVRNPLNSSSDSKVIGTSSLVVREKSDEAKKRGRNSLNSNTGSKVLGTEKAKKRERKPLNSSSDSKVIDTSSLIKREKSDEAKKRGRNSLNSNTGSKVLGIEEAKKRERKPLNSSSDSKVIDTSSSVEREKSNEAKKRERKPSKSTLGSAVSNTSSSVKRERSEETFGKSESGSIISRSTSASTVESMQTSQPKSQTKKRGVKSRNTHQESINFPLDAETETEKDTFNTDRNESKARTRKRKNSLENLVDGNSSIIEMQEKRTRSKVHRTIAANQTTATLQSNKIDALKEMPSTSKVAEKHMTNKELKTAEQSVLKLAFTMVDPEKKEDLLKHANNKWMEAQDPSECEVLVMDTGNRTLKFLIALAKGIPIVTSEWLEAIKATGVISVRSNYFFKDTTFEKSFKFSLLYTLNEAKKAKLFKNFQFLLTNNLMPTPNDMKVIIIAAGGIILDNENIPKEKENQQLYLISSEKDRQHWHSYRRKNSNICITSTEAVMLAIMRYDYKILKKRSF